MYIFTQYINVISTDHKMVGPIQFRPLSDEQLKPQESVCMKQIAMLPQNNSLQQFRSCLGTTQFGTVVKIKLSNCLMKFVVLCNSSLLKSLSASRCLKLAHAAREV